MHHLARPWARPQRTHPGVGWHNLAAINPHQALLTIAQKTTVNVFPQELGVSRNYFPLDVSPKAGKAVQKMCAFF